MIQIQRCGRLKYTRNESGAVAVEFALLAIPFFLLVIAILELAIMFAAESLMEGATMNASRQIKTGALQTSGEENLEALFRDELCSYATVLIRCEDVQIEVRELDSFADAGGMQPQFNEEGDFVSSGFDPGGSSAKVLIRTVYKYTALSPLLGTLLFGQDNSRLFMSTLVMQSEPYDFAAELAESGELD